MNILKTIIHNHYFWIGVYCLYAIMLFLILPDEMNTKNQLFRYFGIASFMYWTRAFMLNKTIGIGIASFPPGQGHDIIRTVWFLMCIYILITYPLYLLSISVF